MNKLQKIPYVVIAVIICITAFFSYQLKNVKIDNDTEKFLPESDPTRVEYDRHEELFGSSEIVTIMLESKKGNIFNTKSIETIYEMTKEIEKHSLVEEVMSLTNTDYIKGEDGSISVKPLVEDFNGTEEEINQLKSKLLSWDVYQDVLVSKDFSSAQILVTIKPGVQVDGHEQIYRDMKMLTEKYSDKSLKFYIAGLPAVSVLFSEYMVQDLNRLIPFVVVILLLTLFLSFKRFSGVLLPLLTVVISTIWTIGLMGLVGVPLSMIGTIIPVIMIAVGSAYGIHIISHYYDDLGHISNDLTKENHNKIIGDVVKKVSRPILLAGLTTVAGFGSLSVSKIVPMKEFGIFTSVGIVSSLIVALSLIPSLLIIKFSSINISKEKKRGESNKLLSTGLTAYYNGFGHKKYTITFLAVAVVIFASIGTSRMVVDNAFIGFFKEDSDIRISDKFAREEFTGTKAIDIVVEGEGVGLDPEILYGLDELGKYLVKEYPEVSKTSSLADPLKRLNQVMHADSGNETYDDFEGESDWDYGAEYEDNSFFDEFDSEEETTEVVVENSDQDARYSENISAKALVGILDLSYSRTSNIDISGAELISLLKREINYNGYSYYEVPTDPEKYGQTEEGLRNLISQYYVSGGTEDYIGKNDDSLSPNHIKMTVMLNNTGDVFTAELLKDIKRLVPEYIPPETKVTYSGSCLQESALTEIITSSAIQSVLISLFCVFLILAIYFRSIIAGILGIIPLGFTVLVNYAVMGFAGIKLDMTTGMLGSIAIGIGVDYTIHFLESYRHNWNKDLSEDDVTKKSLLSSGKAIIVNALSVALGFGVLMASNFNPVMNLGLLITITMCVASLASLTIMPSLLNIIKPKFVRK